MTIKTLEFIHATLVEKAQQTNEVFKASNDLNREYKQCENVSEELIKRQTEVVDKYSKEYLEAHYALEEFENHEWR